MGNDEELVPVCGLFSVTCVKVRVRLSPFKASTQATTRPFVPPVPQISFNGSNVTNNGTPSCPGNVACVFVGQKIALTTNMSSIKSSLPADVTVQSYSWSMPPQGTVVGGYNPSTASGMVQHFPIAQPGTCQTLAESCLTFYWVDQGSSRTLTFSYTLSTGQARSAAVTFSVGGPTNVGIAVTPPLNRNLIQTVQANPLVLATNRQVLVFGSNVPGGQKGIRLQGSATLPSDNQGQYSWIQLLTTRNVYFTTAQGRWLCPLDDPPEHDGVYNPNNYLGPTFEDSPWSLLPMSNNPQEIQAEVADSFKASAYLMWTPNAASGCVGAACTILVPLAQLNWSWSGDAINTLVSQPSGTAWVLTDCQGCLSEPSRTTTSYPEWRKSMGAPAGCLPRQIQ